MSDSRLQEIVTQAVVGRAERRVTWGHTVPAEGVTGVLGVHVTNSTVALKDEGGSASVELMVDADLWVSTSKGTKVMRVTGRNSEAPSVRTFGRVLGDHDYKVSATGPARVTGVSVTDGQVTLQLEADYSVEMSALSRFWVRAYDLESEVLRDLDAGESGSGTGTGVEE